MLHVRVSRLGCSPQVHPVGNNMAGVAGRDVGLVGLVEVVAVRSWRIVHDHAGFGSVSALQDGWIAKWWWVGIRHIRGPKGTRVR